jgi:hypothetical protein
MEPEHQHLTDILYHAPVGTCLEVSPGCWLVRGKTGSYELNEAERTCKCPHFVERLKGSGECKHLVRLREFLATGDKTCPCCRGEGCDGCDGLGRVSGSMHPILLEIRRAEDEARNKALLEIFR